MPSNIAGYDSSMCDCGQLRMRFISRSAIAGVGFDLETARKTRGLGLNRTEERLKLVKGSLSIDAQPERGTTIHRSRSSHLGK